MHAIASICGGSLDLGMDFYEDSLRACFRGGQGECLYRRPELGNAPQRRGGVDDITCVS